MKTPTYKLVILIYLVSRSLKHYYNGRGERLLVQLYSELIRRYSLLNSDNSGKKR